MPKSARDRGPFEFPVCPVCQKPMQLTRIEPNSLRLSVPHVRIFECTICGRSVTITADADGKM